MHFQHLECHFSPGFLAEGRRGLAQMFENTPTMLENALKMYENTLLFFNAIFHEDFSPKAAADEQKNC